MPEMPGNPWWDSTLAFMAEGYGFISKRCARYHSPVFVTRLFLQRTICLRGAQAVRSPCGVSIRKEGQGAARRRPALQGIGCIAHPQRGAQRRPRPATRRKDP